MKLWRGPAGQDRGGRDPVRPGDGPAARVQASREAVVIIGPVQIVLDILLARPDDLHGAIDLLGDLYGPDHAIDIEPAAEAAADQMIVDLDLLLGEAGDLGRGGLSPRQNLRANPNLACAGPHMHGAVHRLHGGVGEERHLIDGLDFLRRPAEAPSPHRRPCARSRRAFARRYPVRERYRRC